jgi:hypothetical protein
MDGVIFNGKKFPSKFVKLDQVVRMIRRDTRKNYYFISLLSFGNQGTEHKMDHSIACSVKTQCFCIQSDSNATGRLHQAA